MIPKTIIKITMQGPMPDTDREPGIWIADLRREIISPWNSNKYRFVEQSWKADDLDKMLQAVPEIIIRMLTVETQPR